MSAYPRGVFSASLTPLNADLSPDHATLLGHCKHLIAEGCDGIALLGTTGEANSFSLDERKAILAAMVEGGIAPGRLLPGTGVCALPETIALTKHALSLGVETVVMLPPFYYKGVSDDGLVAAYSHVIETIGDARLKVVLYHIPPMAQIPITFGVVERLLAAYPDTIVGIKDSGGELDHMVKLAQTFPTLSILAGADPLLLPLLGQGGAGCITATSNLVAAELKTIFLNHADPEKADLVAAAQAKIVGTRNKGNSYPQIATLKAMLAQKSGHDGWRRVRPPHVALDDAQFAALAAI
ncbi:dihydrodipicolinate synthase family protein [Kaistia dalseonensis]|uniref:4-hydroxy-tetrahydrodipicolinate synthase n=1 Tax=Kaistia dalseonensis TaxID=410840 RepID=A0ABU0HCT0_9HYPH|nr:dihydrodipicolinate synthase family protein [Kaistia dalseonensis]MCX5496705.1 dihydrodipicolinate synthase family protein [Kaistia dalseonensis]MDQ0439331.1 4-hydroxy-tetrahydrodipicolinate synthase [Kaistia dalseonensis]